ERVRGALNRVNGGLGFVLAAFKLDARRDDVRFRQRPGFDQPLIVLELRIGQIDRFAFDLLVAPGEYQVPVSALNLGDDLDRALAELTVRYVQTFFRDLDLTASRIDRAVAQDRLRERKTQIGRILRVERDEQVIGSGAVVVADAWDTASLPRRALRKGGRAGHVAGFAAGEYRGGGNHAMIVIERRRQVRIVEALRRAQIEFVHLHVQAFDLDVAVVFERHRHRVTQR